ncbi:MAG: DUF4153 domain-containing protein [Gudongella sp.]|jgi:hypothetical protein|nr:DUF4153 domain-containing protein [Gudongella sp.]
MNAFTRSITKVTKSAMESMKTFPAAIISALAFSIVAWVRIYLDWPEQEAYNFLFSCLHWALGFGAIFGITSVTYTNSRFDDKKWFGIANIMTVGLVILTFVLLYFTGGRVPGPDDYTKYTWLKSIAQSRMVVLYLITTIAFVIFSGLPIKKPDVGKSIFMFQKAFVVAAIYGGVMMIGISTITGAIQVLLYNDMSYKVYQYLGTVVGFITFTIFAGFFPDFTRREEDEKRAAAETQSKFLVVLFSYIMIPIIMVLTVVFLLWSLKTVFEGIGSNFIRLSGIAISYAIVGIWLHIMVSEHDNGLAKFYRKSYPVAALVILAFEAWALIEQLSKYGLQTTEYFFSIIWVIAVISMIAILVKKRSAYVLIYLLVAFAATVSILPVIGYHSLPARSQTSRLERLLTNAGMLVDGEIIPGSESLDKDVRIGITEAVSFLGYQEDYQLPKWFDKNLNEYDNFRLKMGFDQIWSGQNDYVQQSDYATITLTLKPTVIDISDYQWSFNLPDYSGKRTDSNSFMGERGLYEVNWIMEPGYERIPSITISLNENIIVDESMKEYLDDVMEKYPAVGYEAREVGVEEVSYLIEDDNILVLIVFNTVEISIDKRKDTVNYWLYVNSIYINEK